MVAMGMGDTAMGAKSGVGKPQWLKAGLDILETEGIAGVRVDVLAERFGIAKSGFYRHFKNRKELFTEMLEYWASAVTEVFDSNSENCALPPIDRLTRIAELIVNSDLARYEATITQWALQDRAVARATHEVNRLRLDIVRAAFEELGFSGDDLEARALMFTCYVTWEGPMYRDLPHKRRLGSIARQVRILTSK